MRLSRHHLAWAFVGLVGHGVAHAAEIYSQDFETGTAGVSGAGFLYQTGGYSTLGFGTTMFRNWEGGNPAAATVVTFVLGDAHQAVTLDFDLAVLDSWDGNSSLGGCCNTDLFTVTLGGQTIFTADFNNVWGYVAPYDTSPDTQSFPRDERMLAGPVANLAGDWQGEAGPDAAYRLSLLLGDLDAGEYTLSFFAGGPGWQAFTDESFALDNIRISSATPVPVPAAAWLLAGGLVGLARRCTRKA